MDEGAMSDAYRQLLVSARDRDRAAGRTLTGPHRSDLEVTHGPKGTPAKMCSTGEQKALLIGLVLAHARLIKKTSGGVSPLILLDEIAAHLDLGRRLALFSSIASLNAQVWMTGTDADIFAPLQNVTETQLFPRFKRRYCARKRCKIRFGTLNNRKASPRSSRLIRCTLWKQRHAWKWRRKPMARTASRS